MTGDLIIKPAETPFGDTGFEDGAPKWWIDYITYKHERGNEFVVLKCYGCDTECISWQPDTKSGSIPRGFNGIHRCKKPDWRVIKHFTEELRDKSGVCTNCGYALPSTK